MASAELALSSNDTYLLQRGSATRMSAQLLCVDPIGGSAGVSNRQFAKPQRWIVLAQLSVIGKVDPHMLERG
jgi:hypothetical protein